MIRWILLLWVMTLAACGSAPVQPQSASAERIKAEEKDARRAMKSGDLVRAHQAFSRELLLQQSLDDTAGAASTAINLATVKYRLNDDAGALALLDGILNAKVLYPADSYIQASFRKAIILLHMGRKGDAEVALQQADGQCQRQCGLQASLELLHARLLLEGGDAQGALALAQPLGGRADVGREEQANALRLVASAEEKLQRYADALQHYQAALLLDKPLGFGGRIAEDLSGMARAAKQLGHDAEAEVYAHRAALVVESMRQEHLE